MSDSQRYHLNQGVWNIMEKGSTRPALQFDKYVHGLQTTLHWKRVFKVVFFLFKWSTVCKACILIWYGGPGQSFLHYIPYSLIQTSILVAKRKIPLFSFIKSVPLCFFPPMSRKHKYSSHIQRETHWWKIINFRTKVYKVLF